jgi:hypothetical protein
MTEYEITVEGCPFRPRYRSEWMGCVVATAFKRWVLDPIAAAARFTRSVELTVRAVDDPYMGGFGMTVQVPDLDAEERARWEEERARLREEAQAREAGARAAELAERRARDLLGYAGRQEPDPRPGPYYVSAIRQGDDGTHGWHALMGPFETHAEAIALVDRVRRYAQAVDSRSDMYAFDTKRHAYPDPPRGKVSLAQLVAWEAEQVAEEPRPAAKRRRKTGPRVESYSHRV